MKTIKTLLKNFKRSTPPKSLPDKEEMEKEETETQACDEERDDTPDKNPKNHNSNPKNKDENETETDEIPGVPRVDTPVAPESGGTFQERGGEIEEAYRRGVIDGRNQQIEEKYFPKADDGVPHFHGRPDDYLSTSSIFSMAREA